MHDKNRGPFPIYFAAREQEPVRRSHIAYANGGTKTVILQMGGDCPRHVRDFANGSEMIGEIPAASIAEALAGEKFVNSPAV